jgi:AraC-like DNA-binding protein
MLFSIPVILFTLLTICIVSAISLYLAYRLKIPASFGKVLKFTLAFIFINCGYAIIGEIYFSHHPWKERIAPFIFLYGPILYFAIISLRDDKLSIKRIILHSIPFLYYFVYLVWLALPITPASPGKFTSFSSQVYILGSISCIVYSVSSFFYAKNLITNRFRDKLLMFVFGRMFIIFFACLILLTISSPLRNHEGGIMMLRMMIYSCMLIFVLIVFNYTVNKLLNRFPTKAISVISSVTETAKYEKSPLSAQELKAYGARLTAIIVEEQLFLDASLSLASLALHLKIPNHHLTQVLSVVFKKSFYQYVNAFRVDYACELLVKKDLNMNFEELGEKSGFNSKVSFYRQFKYYKAVTPAEYRSLQSKQINS